MRFIYSLFLVVLVKKSHLVHFYIATNNKIENID
jgi:hypothetical protein